MKRLYFGTDGVRGPVGGPLINPDFASRLAQAAARWRVAGLPGGTRPLVVIGRDTRKSGLELEAAVSAGFAAEGFEVISLGVLPTPAVSRAVPSQGAAMGVVVTASHNPASDNGIKFFGPDGAKLGDEEEAAIEARLPALPPSGPRSAGRFLDLREPYRQAALDLLPAGCLSGWSIVVDTANGATCETTPEVLGRLGARLTQIGCQPDGVNINAGVGSEFPSALAALVRSEGAALGLAHDGDGDRCVLCDETGTVVNGDELLAILGLHALRTGRLSGSALVATVQSNIGLERALAKAGGRVVRSDVGDRYVLQKMREIGANLGGESSGHVVFSDISPTGDGLVAALKTIEVMLDTGRPLSELRRWLTLYPQRSCALKVREKMPLERLPRLSGEIARLGRELGDTGRVLVRYSGTESKLRLLVEGPDDRSVSSAVSRLESAARAELEVV